MVEPPSVVPEPPRPPGPRPPTADPVDGQERGEQRKQGKQPKSQRQEADGLVDRLHRPIVENCRRSCLSIAHSRPGRIDSNYNIDAVLIHATDAQISCSTDLV